MRLGRATPPQEQAEGAEATEAEEEADSDPEEAQLDAPTSPDPLRVS